MLERLSAVAAAAVVAAAADSETIDYHQPAETFGFEKTVHKAEIQTQDLQTNVHCTHVLYMYSTCVRLKFTHKVHVHTTYIL